MARGIQHHSTMDTHSVSKELAAGEFKIRAVCNSKSAAWTNFGIVIDNENEDLEFATCKQCNHVLAYHGHKTGTTALVHHKSKVKSSQTVLTALVKPLKPKTSMSKATNDAVTAACVDFVCQDLRPFDVVSGSGFVNFVQEVSKILQYPLSIM